MSNVSRIPVSGPSITQHEIDLVTEAVTFAWDGNANVYHERFEKAFAIYCGRKFAVALPSCTSALHLSLLALGIGPGDEVIVPETTWIATSAPIAYVGAVPVFADIDANSWCLDLTSMIAAITPNTKAVIAVDLYGNMPDYDNIQAHLGLHNIPLIEDAAEAIGSEYKGVPAGKFGITSTFSFHGSKTLTTGEGGMLVTDDSLLQQRVLQLRDHGRRPGDTMFFNQEIGYKYKMSSMQAALGLAQLDRLDELVSRKIEIFGWYFDALNHIDGLSLNCTQTTVKNSYWMTTVVLDPDLGIEKQELMAFLSQDGIDTRPFFFPLSGLPAYSKVSSIWGARERNKNAYRISPFAINLPSGLNLTLESVTFVCNSLLRALTHVAH